MVENEIQFLSWKEFKQMAPSILQLELTRLGSLIQALPFEAAPRNVLVKARYDLSRFIACLEAVEQAAVADRCAPHLQAAFLALSLGVEDVDASMQPTIDYVVDRLTYVLHRIDYIY